jgi:hypothetical protein
MSREEERQFILDAEPFDDPDFRDLVDSIVDSVMENLPAEKVRLVETGATVIEAVEGDIVDRILGRLTGRLRVVEGTYTPDPYPQPTGPSESTEDA